MNFRSNASGITKESQAVSIQENGFYNARQGREVYPPQAEPQAEMPAGSLTNSAAAPSTDSGFLLPCRYENALHRKPQYPKA
jgi:hypothetical protein